MRVRERKKDKERDKERKELRERERKKKREGYIWKDKKKGKKRIGEKMGGESDDIDEKGGGPMFCPIALPLTSECVMKGKQCKI